MVPLHLSLKLSGSMEPLEPPLTPALHKYSFELEKGIGPKWGTVSILETNKSPWFWFHVIDWYLWYNLYFSMDPKSLVVMKDIQKWWQTSDMPLIINLENHPCLSKCTKKHELLLKVAVILVFVSVVRVAEFHSVSNEVQETFISQLDWWHLWNFFVYQMKFKRSW